jgi:vacuolar-type H+-ATPase subunit H
VKIEERESTKEEWEAEMQKVIEDAQEEEKEWIESGILDKWEKRIKEYLQRVWITSYQYVEMDTMNGLVNRHAR